MEQGVYLRETCLVQGFCKGDDVRKGLWAKYHQKKRKKNSQRGLTISVQIIMTILSIANNLKHCDNVNKFTSFLLY